MKLRVLMSQAIAWQGSTGKRVANQSSFTLVAILTMFAAPVFGLAGTGYFWEFCSNNYENQAQCFETYREAEHWMMQEPVSGSIGRKYLEPTGEIQIENQDTASEIIRVRYAVTPQPPKSVEQSYIDAMTTGTGGGVRCGCMFGDPAEPHCSSFGANQPSCPAGQCYPCPTQGDDISLLLGVIPSQCLVDLSSTEYPDPPNSVRRGFSVAGFSSPYPESGELSYHNIFWNSPSDDRQPFNRFIFAVYQGRASDGCTGALRTSTYGVSRQEHFLCNDGLRAPHPSRRMNAQDTYDPSTLVGYNEVCGSNTIGTITARLVPIDDCTYGNPCIPSTGAKLKNEVDYSGPNLSLSRTYNSLTLGSRGDYFGPSWNFALNERLIAQGSTTTDTVLHISSEGNFEQFMPVASGDVFRSVHKQGSVLHSLGDDGWMLTSGSGQQKYFDLDGRIISMGQEGNAKSWLYLDWGTVDDGGAESVTEVIRSVADFQGREIVFQYGRPFSIEECNDTANYAHCRGLKIEAAIQPDGAVIEYTYDLDGNLIEVLYGDSTGRRYHYNEAENICPDSQPTACPSGTDQPSFPNWLTGISEFTFLSSKEEVTRFSNYHYDHLGRVIFSARADDKEALKIEYLDEDTARVTFPEGRVRTIEYTSGPGLSRRDLVRTDSDPVTLEEFVTEFEYDSEGRLLAVSDPRDIVRKYEYDADGLHRTASIRADGTSVAVRTEEEFDSLGRVTERRVLGAGGATEQRTAFEYDAFGRPTARCVFGDNALDDSTYQCSESNPPPSNLDIRRWTWVYCDEGDVTGGVCPFEGLLKEQREPGDGGMVATIFEYYQGTNLTGCNAAGPCHRKGDLHTVTYAMGHVTTFVQYDLSGRAVRIKDANDVDTVAVYNSRGWLESSSVAGSVTTYEYLDNGLISRITQPDGSFLDFEYDSAGRLNAIENALGERMGYVLDDAGQRTEEHIFDQNGALRFRVEQVYDRFGRLNALIDGNDNQTLYDYDAVGNLAEVIDALTLSTSHEYDPLNRLQTTLDALQGETMFDYDVSGSLTTVIDAEGLSTHYKYNAFGELVELDSPDTGVTSYTYDNAGNRASQTDARGVTTTYEYDSLNRLTAVTYPDSSLNVSFFYDEETVCEESSPIGRMTSMLDPSGITFYCYDPHGRVASTSRVVNNSPVSVAYEYDATGKLNSLTYPSGKMVSYVRDATGQIIDVLLSDPRGSRIVIANDVTHEPFGPVNSYVLGGNWLVERSHDLAYQTTTITSPALQLHFKRDQVGNIDNLNDGAELPAVIEEYLYDDLHRLESILDAVGVDIEAYSFDLIGNRLSKQTESGTQVYEYPVDSHHLTAVDGFVRGYDAVGNLVYNAIANQRFGYGDNNRLLSYVDGLSRASYVYNGKGQRVAKLTKKASVGAEESAINYVYDESGRLIAELIELPFGFGVAVRREYVYLENLPIAVIDHGAGGDVYFIHADHLGTPRALTDRYGIKRWEWAFQSNPFGEQLPDEDPANTGTPFKLNLRFPGQYFDEESGLHYNYFRDYEPGTGRYVQSDPMGISDGPSTFSYVYQNPFRWLDRLGLSGETEWQLKYHEYRCVNIPTAYMQIVGRDGRVRNQAVRFRQECGWRRRCGSGSCESSRCETNFFDCQSKCFNYWNPWWASLSFASASAVSTFEGLRAGGAICQISRTGYGASVIASSGVGWTLGSGLGSCPWACAKDRCSYDISW